jgi:hypothetical protein
MAQNGAAELTFTGLAELQAHLQILARDAPQELGRGMFEEGSIEMKESMKRTPVLTGALRASHELKGPSYSGRNIEVKITVGGPAAQYAGPVHEDLEADHKVGQAKFLESTLRESGPFLPIRVAKRVDWNRRRS